MAKEEFDEFLAVCKKERDPDAYGYGLGRKARDMDVPFHAGPRPFGTVHALSWRLGWNDRALELTELELRGITGASAAPHSD